MENTSEYCGVQELIDLGIIQEANRLVFHPLGFSLSVVKAEDGTLHLGGVRDFRSLKAGPYFEDLSTPEASRKAKSVGKLLRDRVEDRKKALGWAVQPLGSKVLPPG